MGFGIASTGFVGFGVVIIPACPLPGSLAYYTGCLRNQRASWG